MSGPASIMPAGGTRCWRSWTTTRPDAGAYRHLDLLRRRHPVPDGAGDGRRLDRAHRPALGTDAGAGDHAGSQPDFGRGRALRRVPRRRGQPGVARHPGAGRRFAEVPGPCPQRVGSAGRHRAGGAAFRPLLVRPDLCPPRPVGRGLGSRVAAGAGPCGRAPLGLPAHDRGRHAVPHPAQQGRLRHPRRRAGRRPLRGDAGRAGRRRPAGLRDLQPRPAGRGVAAQPDLLALRRLCRHRSRRPWPADAGRHEIRDPRPSRAGSVAGSGRPQRPRRPRVRGSRSAGAADRVADDGAAAARRRLAGPSAPGNRAERRSGARPRRFAPDAGWRLCRTDGGTPASDGGGPATAERATGAVAAD